MSHREWRIGEAKQSFSEVVRKAHEAPQKIFNRDRLVAAVISGELFEEIEQLTRERARKSLASLASEIREICEGEGYTIEVPERLDRESWLTDEP